MIEGLSAKEAVDLMEDLEVTPKQLFLLMFLHLDKERGDGVIIKEKDDNGSPIALVYRFARNISAWSFDEIDDLVEKGLLVSHNSHSSGGKRQAYPDNYEITETFKDAVISNWEDFEEFWNTYPAFTENFDTPAGPKITLKACDYEEVEKKYRNVVRTKAKHRQVMEVLRWGIKHDIVRMNILKYVGSRMFDQHKELMKEGVTSRRKTVSVNE